MYIEFLQQIAYGLVTGTKPAHTQIKDAIMKTSRHYQVSTPSIFCVGNTSSALEEGDLMQWASKPRERTGQWGTKLF